MHSTSAQFPKEIGKLAAEAAYDHLAGKTVRFFQSTILALSDAFLLLKRQTAPVRLRL